MEEVRLIFLSIEDGILVDKNFRFVGAYNRTEDAVFVGSKWNDNFVLPKLLEWCKIIPFKGAIQLEYINTLHHKTSPSLLVEEYMDSIL